MLQQLYYYGIHGWNNDVRAKELNDFGGAAKDLLTSHDYDPKIFDGPVDIGTGVPSDAAQYWRPNSLDSPYFNANGY